MRQGSSVLQFAEPGWLGLITLAVLPWLRERGRAGVGWPDLGSFARLTRGSGLLARLLPTWLRSLAIASIAVALAGPRTVAGQERVAGRGVAILAAIDQSRSMTTSDFRSPDGTTTTRLD